jgi:hypothetical protein
VSPAYRHARNKRHVNNGSDKELTQELEMICAAIPA